MLMVYGPQPFPLFAQQSAQVQVTVARANIRSGPGTNHRVITTAARGETFAIVGINAAKSWYQIALAESERGWIAGSVVTVTGSLDGVAVTDGASLAAAPTPAPTVVPTTAPAAEAAGGVIVTISRSRVNLRGGPGTNYAVVGGASQGEQFPVTGRNGAGDWYMIQRADGSNAWVSASIVRVTGDAQSVATADAAAPATSNAPAQTTSDAPAPTATPAPAAAPATNTNTVSSSLPRGVAAGRLLYSVANDDAKRWELWEYDFGAQSSTKVADWRTEVDISNDGRQIVYFAWPGDAGEKAGIWIMDADFTNNRLLIPGGAYPSFNPGGDRLVVDGPNTTMYLINSDGGGLRPLASGEYPAWSPVDNRIVHRDCVGGSCGLWVIDANSNDPTARQRITTGGSDGQPSWSPDGKRIAYISKEDGNFEVYVVNSDGTNPVRVTSDPASDGLPVWSPDGRWLAFRSDRGGSWAIYIVRPDGSDLHKVVDADVLDYWFFEKMIWR
ncbi:MAG: PD40 domain-containing protein [Caldilineaceae bacterium]|nr:PD40 domain-containing protein [Caldilineaceae bacterium]